MTTPPILTAKDADAPSVFRPENLLREARRQRGRPNVPVPAICLLDPDGDLVTALRRDGRTAPVPGWACYHTEMWSFPLAGREVGIVGCAVGAPFAVLVAEQMVASGARGIISLTSSGRIAGDLPEGAHFMLIDRALRDEGTSYHYLPADAPFVAAPPDLLEQAARALREAGIEAHTGPSWTTDAPYRETETAIDHARRAGARVVEMEAAALYAFARARGASVLCLAHVTNAMAQTEGDFEKGEADGTEDALRTLGAVIGAWPDRG